MPFVVVVCDVLCSVVVVVSSLYPVGNLSILCLDCHNETQMKGGFGRSLTPDLVTLYRDNWNAIVEKERLSNMTSLHKESKTNNKKMAMITSIIEDLKERKEYVLLSMFYNNIGNKELRDKYIDAALSEEQDPELTIILRSLQGRAGSIPKKIVNAEIKRLRASKNWTQLGRVYADLENWNKAATCYCNGVIDLLKEDNIFGAAYYLKEMVLDKKLHEEFFKKFLRTADERGDLWWHIRTLQELGWETELNALLKTNEKQIKQSGDPYLLSLLYESLNDEDKYATAIKHLFKKTKLVLPDKENS